ncbi:ZIP family metal transporter [uncultured Roseobacter sp.]|uniref:ZIP family metal transporter n=1 Tax=uncultured Roseobacter sp. TaxID=114847 RepID=UPI00261745D5|nr:ZIP family metal transporter [uncultured Roseobacter sp.]
MAGILGSLAAGMMTALGAIPVLLGRGVTVRAQDVLLGFAAGVMLAASFFSLIIPSLEVSEALYGAGWRPALIAVVGILLGGAGILLLDRALPHRHFVSGREGPSSDALKKIWLFVIAITIHNIPEGLAVGIGFGGGNFAGGMELAIGIGLQNAPEGLAVALALQSEGYSRLYAFIVAGLTGLVEPVAGAIGAAAVGVSELMLPWGLVFAAGAMIYVISHEIIPETHRRGHQDAATIGLMIGLVLMLYLDVSLS